MDPDQLKRGLAPALARIFPTAQTIVLHERLVRERGLPHLEDHLFAYDAQGRPLLPLRPWNSPNSTRPCVKLTVVGTSSCRRPDTDSD